MALGLSVIFGVVRVVNFAHGEMMTIAMYLAVVLFAQFHLDPLMMLVPIAAVLFVVGYALQAGLINPFITRPEHSQFCCSWPWHDHRQCAADRVRPGCARRADALCL